MPSDFTMNLADGQWWSLLVTARGGESVSNRTGTDCHFSFGEGYARFNLGDGFPIVTLKEVNFKAALTEILWMIRGQTHTDWLHERGCKIWDPWAYEDGSCGPIYGAQWRAWGGKYDQLQNVLNLIKTDPTNRRMIVSAWNPSDLEDMCLPPCHCFMQFNVSQSKGTLNLQVYQRSADVFIGVPFNFVHYGVLLTVMAHLSGLTPGQLSFCYGDLHLYDNHLNQYKAVNRRTQEARWADCKEPRLIITDPNFTLDTVDVHHFELTDYNPLPFIKAPVAV